MWAGSGSYHCEKTPICTELSPDASTSAEWFASQPLPNSLTATVGNDRDCSPDDFHVKQQTQVIDIVDVVDEALLPGQPISPMNLGQACKPGSHLVAAP